MNYYNSVRTIANRFVAEVQNNDKDLKIEDKDLNKDLKLHKEPKKLPPRMDLRKHLLEDKDFKID